MGGNPFRFIVWRSIGWVVEAAERGRGGGGWGGVFEVCGANLWDLIALVCLLGVFFGL